MNKNYEDKECMNMIKQSGSISSNIEDLERTVQRYEMIIKQIENKIFIPLPQCCSGNIPEIVESMTINSKIDEIRARIILANGRLDGVLQCLINQLGDDLKLE